MKNFVVAVLMVCGIFVTGFAQSGSRPRTAPNSNSGGSSAQKSTLPPFLGGGIGNSNSNSNRTNQPRTTNAPPQTVPTPSPQDSPTAAPKEKPTLKGAQTSTQPQTSATPAANGETDEDEEVIRIETELVTLPVTVLDRQGRFVPRLQQTDFQIFEDGKQQEIAYFAKTEQPFTVVLLLDVSNSTKFKIDEIQNAAIGFVRQLKSNDKVMVISFDEKIHVLAEPTTDRYKIAEAIMRTQIGGGTSLYDAVDAAINTELRRVEGRKAVVLFTDGVDTTSSRSSYEQTLRDAEELDATIYTIFYDTFEPTNGNQQPQQRNPQRRRGGGGLGDIIGIILGGGNVQIGGGGGGGNSRGNSRAEHERGERYTEDLAAKTGGRKYRADSTKNLESAFYNIAEELRQQYSIGYYPAETGQTGQRKSVKVRVNQQGLIVRTRDSYVVGQPNNGAAQKGKLN